MAPNNIADASFNDVTSTLVSLYSTKKSVLGASVQFFNCKQKPGQLIEYYDRDIKYFSQQCGFQAEVSLSRIQRDVFLAGLNSTPVTTSILQISDDLSFDEADHSKAFTQLRQDASMLHNPAHHADTFDNARRMHDNMCVFLPKIQIRIVMQHCNLILQLLVT